MRQTANYTIFNAQGSTATGIAVLCEDYRHVIFSLATDGGSDASFTIKFQGAIDEGATTDSAPAFGSAQTVTNHWDYIEVIDLQSGTAIDGDTGVAVAGADDYRLFEANINGLKYVCARLTAYAEGEITVKVRLFND